MPNNNGEGKETLASVEMAGGEGAVQVSGNLRLAVIPLIRLNRYRYQYHCIAHMENCRQKKSNFWPARFKLLFENPSSNPLQRF
jgi:hypothetical protein